MTDAAVDDADHAKQARWDWRRETDTMYDVFLQIRELIERLYEWFRLDRNGRNGILLSKLLAENCESTLLALFGEDALENVQLAFLDLSVLV